MPELTENTKINKLLCDQLNSPCELRPVGHLLSAVFTDPRCGWRNTAHRPRTEQAWKRPSTRWKKNVTRKWSLTPRLCENPFIRISRPPRIKKKKRGLTNEPKLSARPPFACFLRHRTRLCNVCPHFFGPMTRLLFLSVLFP